MTLENQIKDLLAITLDQAGEVIVRMRENGVEVDHVNKRVLHMEAKIAAQEIGVLVRRFVK